MTRIAPVTALVLLAFILGITLLSSNVTATGGVRIYGFVRDRAGLPVSNATVTLLIDNTPLLTASNPAITDLNGYYEFAGIQRGVYCLTAEKNFHSTSATIRLQTWDLLVDLPLGGSTAELADVHAPSATLSPSATPANVTETPGTPTVIPSPSAAPGFDIVIALLGIFSLITLMRPKK